MKRTALVLVAALAMATAMVFFMGVASAKDKTPPRETTQAAPAQGTTTQGGDTKGSSTNSVSPNATRSFSNSDPITIPDSGAASPYPSEINVSGIGSRAIITDVNLTLHNFSHTCPDDIDMLLVGPTGKNLIVMSDVGGCGTNVSDVTFTLDDQATSTLNSSDPMVDGTSYKPSNVGGSDTFDPPAPTPSTKTKLSTFNFTRPNGTWKLYVMDNAGGDSGQFAGGWSLDIKTLGG